MSLSYKEAVGYYYAYVKNVSVSDNQKNVIFVSLKKGKSVNAKTTGDQFMFVWEVFGRVLITRVQRGANE